MAHYHDPLRPHSHDPNPAPPSESPDFVLSLPDGRMQTITPDDLRRLPQTTVPDCHIVSSGHGTSGPFAFTGVTLAAFVAHCWPGAWAEVEVIGGDGFGTRLIAEEANTTTTRPILLVHSIDGQPLTRAAGLVRLIVPSETDDALRQVKWVGEMRILNAKAQRDKEAKEEASDQEIYRGGAAEMEERPPRRHGEILIGIDVGGTFTDFLLSRDGEEPRIFKVLSTPDDPSIGLINGLAEIAADTGLSLTEFARSIDTVVHGTTVTTNAWRITTTSASRAFPTNSDRVRFTTT